MVFLEYLNYDRNSFLWMPSSLCCLGTLFWLRQTNKSSKLKIPSCICSSSITIRNGTGWLSCEMWEHWSRGRINPIESSLDAALWKWPFFLFLFSPLHEITVSSLGRAWQKRQKSKGHENWIFYFSRFMFQGYLVQLGGCRVVCGFTIMGFTIIPREDLLPAGQDQD